MQVKFSFAYMIQRKGSWNPPNDISNLNYTLGAMHGLKDNFLVNFIPHTGLLKIDKVEVLGLRKRLVTLCQLLIELVCKLGDVILDICGGSGEIVNISSQKCWESNPCE